MKKMKFLLAGAVLGVSVMACQMTSFAAEEVKSTFEIAGAEVANNTELVIKEGTIDTVKDGDAEVSNVTLTDETGASHVFEKVDVEDWKDLKFVEDYEMYYIQYTDKEGKSREAEEKVEEKLWEQPVTMYACGNVNVRTEPVNGAEAIYYASLGEELPVIGIAPGWFKVKVNDDLTGYIYHKYMTEDKAIVDALVAEAEAAAAAQAAYDDYQEDYSYSAPSGGSSSKKSSGGKKQCLNNGLLY